MHGALKINSQPALPQFGNSQAALLIVRHWVVNGLLTLFLASADHITNGHFLLIRGARFFITVTVRLPCNQSLNSRPGMLFVAPSGAHTRKS